MSTPREIAPADFQQVLNDHINQFGIESLEPKERERARYEEVLTMRRDREIERIQQLKMEAQQALQNLAGGQGNALANMMMQRDALNQQMMQYGSGAAHLQQAMQEHSFVAKKPMFQNAVVREPTGPTPIDATGDAARQAQDHGLMNMNQIARAKYAPLFDLLDIKLRFTHAGVSGMVKQWVIAKFGKNGLVCRQEWTAPNHDPGCSLRTWDAMVAELLDEVARRDGVEIQRSDEPDTAGAEVAGQQVAGSAGNP